jgi:hypothetical protein
MSDKTKKWVTKQRGLFVRLLRIIFFILKRDCEEIIFFCKRGFKKKKIINEMNNILLQNGD